MIRDAVWREYAKQLASFTVKIWLTFAVLSYILLRWFGPDFSRTLTILGLVSLFVLTPALLSFNRWTTVGRRTSASITQFWMGSLSLVLLGSLLNLGLFALWQLVMGDDPRDLLMTLELRHWLWIASMWFVFQLDTATERTMVEANLDQAKRKLKYLLLLYGLMIGITYEFTASPLAGAATLQALLFFRLLHHNPAAVNSFPKSARNKMLIVSLALVALGALMTHLTSRSYAPRRDSCSAADLAAVATPRAWFKCTNGIAPDRRGPALDRLEQICPPRPTDRVTVIRCEDPRETFNISLGRWRNEATVLEDLNAAGEYRRLLALLTARQMTSRSEAVTRRIEELAQTPGRLGLVAQVTLAGTERKDDKSPWIEVRSR